VTEQDHAAGTVEHSIGRPKRRSIGLVLPRAALTSTRGSTVERSSTWNGTRVILLDPFIGHPFLVFLFFVGIVEKFIVAFLSFFVVDRYSAEPIVVVSMSSERLTLVLFIVVTVAWFVVLFVAHWFLHDSCFLS
jgi:hypothetical protein